MKTRGTQNSRVPGTPASGGDGEVGVAIRVRGLRKRYGAVEAVRGIDLTVQTGEIFAFLGPNGAGKTTTVETLEGYRHRDAGEVEVLGADPAHPVPGWRARIGVVLQESETEAELTVEECVSLYAGYYPRPRPVAETLELVGLADRKAARCGRLSGGQRRRLDVALALIGDPELVFLDEPTTGFDPAARQSAWDVIAGLRDLGKTIFLTTHYMEEAERLADRIAVIAAGHIVAEGTAATLGGRDAGASIVSFTLPPGVSAAGLPAAVAAAVTGGPGERSKHASRARCRCSAPWPPGRRRATLTFPTFRCSARRLRTSTCNSPGSPDERRQPRQGYAAGSRRQLLHLAAHQFRADLRCFFRNKGSVFFTLALPVLFLVIFGSVFQHQNVAVPGGRIDEPVYYVPAIIAYGVIAAAFSNLIISVVRYRETGIYKRRRATPLPASAVIAARALVAALSVLVITAVLLAIGWAAFAAHIPAGPARLFSSTSSSAQSSSPAWASPWPASSPTSTRPSPSPWPSSFRSASSPAFSSRSWNCLTG